jgi:hypothetical protein
VDIVLGVSMTPAGVRMVLVQGGNADGFTVDEGSLDVVGTADSAAASAADRVLSAIVGTREGAAEAGHQLSSIGVTWTDEVEAAVLRDALAAEKIKNVMLVSAFLAAAALAQSVGGALDYEHTAMLFIEPERATLAVVETADGSIAHVHTQPVGSADIVVELTSLIAGLEALQTRPDGLFVVGSGVDIAAIKPQLQEATCLAVSAPAEPDMALAQGAALASANAPLFASSTAAQAYSRDAGTGEMHLGALAGYLSVPDVAPGAEEGEEGEELAYSALPDEDADAPTVVVDTADGKNKQGRRRVLLIGSASAVVCISAVVALEIALAIGLRPTLALRPNPGRNLIVPTQQAPRPVQESNHLPNLAHQPVVAPPAVNAVAPAAPPPGAPPLPVPIFVPALPVPVPEAPEHMPSPGPLMPQVPAQGSTPTPQAPLPTRVPPPRAHPPVPPPQVTVPPPAPPPRGHPPAPPPQTHYPGSPPRGGPPDSPPPGHNPGHQPPGDIPGPQPPVHEPGPGGPPAHGNPGGGEPPRQDPEPNPGGGGGFGEPGGGHDPGEAGGGHDGDGGGGSVGGEIGGGGGGHSGDAGGGSTGPGESGSAGGSVGGGSVGGESSGGASTGGGESAGGGASSGGGESGGHR